MILNNKLKNNIQIRDFLKFKNCQSVILNKKINKEKLYNSILKYINNPYLREKNFLRSKKLFNIDVMKKKQTLLINKIKSF